LLLLAIAFALRPSSGSEPAAPETQSMVPVAAPVALSDLCFDEGFRERGELQRKAYNECLRLVVANLTPSLEPERLLAFRLWGNALEWPAVIYPPLLQELTEVWNAFINEIQTTTIAANLNRYRKDGQRIVLELEYYGALTPHEFEEVTWPLYLQYVREVAHNMDMVCKDEKVVIAVRANKRGGGIEKSKTPWFCKSHLFTYFLMRNASTVFQTHPLFFFPEEMDKSSKWSDGTMIAFVDASYSGEEVKNLIHFMAVDKPKLFILVPCASEYAITNWSTMYVGMVYPEIYIVTDTEPDAPSRGRVHRGALNAERLKDLQSRSADGIIVVLVGEALENRRFLLPFKLADHTSYEGVIKSPLPDVKAFYRASPVCSDGNEPVDLAKAKPVLAEAMETFQATSNLITLMSGDERTHVPPVGAAAWRAPLVVA
jgi:hypothetical protein